MAGLTDKEIAATLGISIHTVRTYWERIRDRIGKETRAEVIAEVSRRRSEDQALGELGRLIADADAKRAALEEILGLVPMLIWEMDHAGRFTYFNERFRAYVGSSADAITGKTWEEVFSKLVPAEFFEAVRKEATAAQVLATTFEREAPLRRAGGEYRWHLIRTVPIFGDSGEVTMVVAAATDIHELHNRERVASERESRLRMAADVSEKGVAYCDPTTGNFYNNAAYARITGSTASECSWTDAVHPDDRPLVEAQWEKALASGVQLRSEHRYLHADGSVTRAKVKVLAVPGGGWVLLADTLPLATPESPDADHLNRLAVVLGEILGLATKSG